MRLLKLVAALVLLCSLCIPTQAQVSHPPIRSVTADPATCSPTASPYSNWIYRRDLGVWKYCSAANTWTSVTAGAVSSVFGLTGAVGVAGTDGYLLSWASAAPVWVPPGVATNPQTGDYAIVTGDLGKLIRVSKTSAVALTIAQCTAAGFPTNWYTYIYNVNTGLVTLTPATSTIFDGTAQAATLTLGQGDWAKITCDGTNYGAQISRPETKWFGFILGADNGSALTTGDDQKSIIINRTGRTIVLTEVFIQCDATDGSTSFNIQNNDGSAANILTSDVTCNSTGTAGTLSATEKIIANGSAIDLLTVTANTAKRMTIIVSYR